MAIADTITSMQNHTSNAYTMIGYGTDLTGINKNLENLSSTIFEAFLEALRNPDTLFTNLPKTSGSGSQITLNGTAYAPMRITLGSSALVQRNLPTEYTQVDYIESSGTQYIDTGLVANQNITFDISFQEQSGSNAKIFGSRITSGTGAMAIYFNSTDELTLNYGSTIYLAPNTDLYKNKIVNLKTIINGSDYEIYIDGALINTFTKYTNNYYNGNMLFGSYNNGGTPANFSGTFKMYHCKIYDNGTLVRNLLPCYKNSNNEAGMYDMIQNKFYSNAGTGTLTYGSVASPNPSYPQDIHTISGNNSVVVNNGNLFPLDTSQFPISSSTSNLTATLNSDGSLQITGTKSTSGWENIFLPRIDNQYVTFYKDITYTSAFTISMYTKANNSWVGNKSGTFTPTEDWYGSSYFWTTNQQRTFNETFYPMIIIGNGTIDSNTWEPYQEPQTASINLGEYELGTIGNYSNEFVRSGGEQLFDSERTLGTPSNTAFSNATNRLFNYNEFVKGMTTNNYYSPNNISYASISDNKLEIETTGGGYGVGMAVKTEPNTQYTIRFNANPTNTDALAISYYQSDGAYISNSSSLGNNYLSFTTPSNCDFILVILRPPKDTRTIYSNIMLVEGSYTASTMPDFVPYEKGWYYKQGIGKVVLDGTESWTKQTTWSAVGNKTNAFYIGKPTNLDSTQTCFSSHFTHVPTSTITSVDDYGIAYASNLIIRVPKSIDTNSDLQTWLSNNNVTIKYVALTPTYTKITGELANQLEQVYKGMLSYDGTTNISQVNNDLPFVISASGVLGE